MRLAFASILQKNNLEQDYLGHTLPHRQQDRMVLPSTRNAAAPPLRRAAYFLASRQKQSCNSIADTCALNGSRDRHVPSR